MRHDLRHDLGPEDDFSDSVGGGSGCGNHLASASARIAQEWERSQGIRPDPTQLHCAGNEGGASALAKGSGRLTGLVQSSARSRGGNRWAPGPYHRIVNRGTTASSTGGP